MLGVFATARALDFPRAVWYNCGMKKVRLTAFAKANVSLNITGKKDRLHTLDSIMTAVDIFDTVTVTERADGEICVRFINADVHPIENTAYKACAAVRDKLGCGADIEIEKGIPIGAGLGGSSADGAAVLRALDLFYRLPASGVDMREVALGVGSDVPFMLTGGTARVSGKGEELFFFDNKLPLFAVGLMSESVSTAAAYALFDETCGDSFVLTDNAALTELLMNGDEGAVKLFGNALTSPAEKIAPSVKENARILAECGAVPCLTGSGGMTLGWFTDIQKFAACADRLKGKAGFKAMSVVRTGILHEWLSRE